MLTGSLFFPVFAKAQEPVKNAKDSTILRTDTLARVKKVSKNALKSPVAYSAADSIHFDIKGQKVFLYGGSEINFEKINLKAADIQIDFQKKQVAATGRTDSAGKEAGMPQFSEGDQTFRSKILQYNFETKKGLIKNVITKEGDGYLHGNTIKKMGNDVINIRQGKYTTCNLDHPHYELRFTKAKVIPDDKIITGPAFMVVSDVPTPAFVPFGFFPNRKGRTNGLIIPTVGESTNRGFYFEDGGYYMGLGQFADLKVTGDIYTRGSWAVKTISNYNKRYRYSGNLNLTYGINLLGTPGTTDYTKSQDFAVRWLHQQSDKARPHGRFSANVNIVSNKYNAYNPTSTSDYLTNTFESSINYSTSFNDKAFLSAAMRHSQNIGTKQIDMSLPQMNFSVNRFYPFRKKDRIGKPTWYDNIGVNYSMEAQNQLSTYDSLLDKMNFSSFRNGIRHSIPVSGSVNLLKYFNWSNSVNFTERWYFQKILKSWSNDTLISGSDTAVGYVKNDTVHGFQATHDYSFSSSLSTRVYGMFQFRRGYIKAIRHVLTPSVGFSYVPDFGAGRLGYYKYYQDGAGKLHKYSIFEGSLYGSPPSAKSGAVNFSFSNNLEMKVRSKSDTLTGFKKITLIDNLSVNTSYDLAKDSCRWSPISISGRSLLFKKLNVTYAASFDPYALDSSGTRRINKFEWDQHHRLLRFNSSSWNFGLEWRLSSEKKQQPKSSNYGSAEELENINKNPDHYLDFNNPWNLNISYNLRRSRTYDPVKDKNTDTWVQTVNLNGDVNVTPKWKVAFRSGYDFKAHDFTYNSINIVRDLHCWEMLFEWIPTGIRKSWNFTLRVKSPVLQDLKLTKKKDFRDYQ